MSRCFTITACVLLLSVSPVLAQEVVVPQGTSGQSSSQTPLSGVSIGVNVSTLGIGPQLGYKFSSGFGMRADAAFFGYDDNFHAGHVDYDGHAHFESYGLVGDFYPFAGSFRLTGGLRLNENDVTAVSNPYQTLSFHGFTAPAGELGSLSGKATFNQVDPYAGFGWAFDLGSGLGLTTDFGAMYQGRPHVSLNLSGPASLVPGAGAAVQSERAELQHDANGFTFYPVVEIGLVYKF